MQALAKLRYARISAQKVDWSQTDTRSLCGEGSGNAYLQ